jgi:hypothetical protein
MSTTATPVGVEGTHAVVLKTPTLAWALRRTLLGLVILFVFIAAAASLLYASIEPDEDNSPAAATSSSGGQVTPSLSGHRPAMPSPARRV